LGGGVDVKVSKEVFGALIGASLVLTVLYPLGHRRNLKLAKRMAALLEEQLQPQDQEYTWLGGVMGFTGEFKVPGFRKVMVVYRLLPRQSVLWLPFHFLTGDRDTVQALFYLKEPPSQEIHMVKRGLLSRPKIYNLASLKEKRMKRRGSKVRILYERDPDPAERLADFLGDELPLVRHLAVTKEKGVLYLELPLPPSHLEKGASLLGRVVHKRPALEKVI